MAVLTLTEKLDQLDSRYEEMTQQLSSPEVVGDSARFQKIAKQHAELEEIVAKHREYRQIVKDLAGAHQLFLEADDAEMKQMAHDEEKALAARKETVERERFLFVVRHLLHLGVVRFEEELMRPGEIFHDLLVFAMFRDDFLELGMLLGDLLKARGITHDFRRRELLRHLLVARIELVQLFGQCKNGHGNLSFRFEALD